MAGENNNNRQRNPGKPNSEFGIQQPSTDIPKFDLADEIMAEQRKITATRRKSPSAAASWHGLPAREDTAKLALSKVEGMAVPRSASGQQVEPISDAIEQPGDVPFDQEQIIAEIVARDIKRLLQGESRNRSGAGA
jgi:hypothetical protein